MDDEEWTLVQGFQEAKHLLGENDTETVKRAKELATYYRECSRPRMEEPIRELIW